MLDSYCIPRDMTSKIAAYNFLATAPVIAKDARGPGQHTALVAQFDVIVFALDPMNLKQGLIFAVDPLPDPSKEAATISTDFLALSTGGSLICQGWDDTKNEVTIFAIPGILQFSPTTGGGGSSPAANTAGVVAGSLVGVAMVAAAVWVWRVGGVGVAGGIVANLPGVSHVVGLVKGGGGGYKGTSGSQASKLVSFSQSSSDSYGASSPAAASFQN